MNKDRIIKGLLSALIEEVGKSVKDTLSDRDNFNDLIQSGFVREALKKPENREYINRPETVQFLEKNIGKFNTQKLVQYMDDQFGPKNRKITNTLQDNDDEYSILGISPNATNDQIIKRYRELSLEFHPDKAFQTTNGIKELATEKFKKIKTAFESIKRKRNF